MTRNIIEVDIEQYQNARDLHEYFQEVQWDCINQDQGDAIDRETGTKQPCCFGAHATLFFKDQILKMIHDAKEMAGPKQSFWEEFADEVIEATKVGEWNIFNQFMQRLIGVHQDHLRERGGGPWPFLGDPWPDHPKDVLKRCIDDMVIVEDAYVYD